MGRAIDWFILLHVGGAVNALIILAFKHPDPIIVGTVCTAVPTMLGLYHWFTVRDSKTPDAS
jgi:hypothetical protein